MAQLLCHRLMGSRYWVRILVPAPTQSGFLIGSLKQYVFILFIKMVVCTEQTNGLNGAVAMSLANGLVGTGFTSRYRLTQAVHFIPFTTMKVCT